MFVRKTIFFAISAFLFAACSGSPSGGENGGGDTVVEADADVLTDVGVDSSEDTSSKDSEVDSGVSKKYKKACSLCEKRNGSCKGSDAMPISADTMKKEKLAEQICNCPNPESFEEEDPEPCNKPCYNEKEVQHYSWNCPNSIHEDDNTYVVNVKDNKCVMKNAHGFGPVSEGKLAWKYDGGSKLKRYRGGDPEWVTCVGSCVKPSKCSEP